MNAFQKQLKVEGKRMSELHNEFVDRGEFRIVIDGVLYTLGHVETGAPPVQVSIEEFESDMRRTRKPAPAR